jgi:glucosamine-6-phosphate deaminase
MKVIVRSTDWAEHVAEALIGRLLARPGLKLCLPTGLTPVPMYRRVAAAVRAGRVSFRNTEVVLLDEFGGVSADDPGRCDRMLERDLLAHVDLPAKQFHRFDLSGDIAAACAEHERVVGEGCDLALLGLGTNGHVGMNEPGSPADSLTRRVDLAPETIAASQRYFAHSNLPTWGVTMGIDTLRRSREIWLLATGPVKAAIVRDMLLAPVSPLRPSSLLREHDCAVLIVDDEAAELLPVAGSSQPAL